MANEYIIQGVGITVGQTLLYSNGVAQAQLKQNPAGRDKALYNSTLGTPVYGDFTVDPFNYTVDGVTYYVPGVKLYALTCEAAGSKNIIRTPIQGLGGTVKEYISSGDDQILIQGTIAGQNGIYPYSDVNDLKKLIDAPVAFKAVNKWLQNLGIDTLVITGYEIPQLAGNYSFQDFRIFCESDFPVELNIVSSSNTSAQ